VLHGGSANPENEIAAAVKLGIDEKSISPATSKTHSIKNAAKSS
jgi:fructose/tagatose bisphosphate aldolase